jgi:hypothetical protein
MEVDGVSTHRWRGVARGSVDGGDFSGLLSDKLTDLQRESVYPFRY